MTERGRTVSRDDSALFASVGVCVRCDAKRVALRLDRIFVFGVTMMAAYVEAVSYESSFLSMFTLKHFEMCTVLVCILEEFICTRCAHLLHVFTRNCNSNLYMWRLICSVVICFVLCV